MKQERCGTFFGICALAAGTWALAACAPHQVKVSAKAPVVPATASAPAIVQTPAVPAPTADSEQTFAQASKDAKALRFHGIIESIDAGHGEIVAKSLSGDVRTFKIASDTKFEEGGNDKVIDLSTVRAGEHVRIIHAGDCAGIVHVMVLSSAG